MKTLSPDSVWLPFATMLLAAAHLLSGDDAAADDGFVDVGHQAPHLGAHNLIPATLAERALIAIGRDEWAQADTLARQAVWTAQNSRLQDAPLNALAFAVAARIAQHAGRSDHAQELIAQAQRRLPQSTHVSPVVATQSRLQLAQTYIASADPAGARTMLREVDAILRRCQGLGSLGTQADQLRLTLRTRTRETPGASALTTAELRVLPLLTTHLTAREIAERLHLSFHTVKSHMLSIYRKLDANSRGSAITRAQQLGLV